MKDRRSAVVSSALWAAYGDALGFISELTDESGVKKRIGQSRIEQLQKWRRRVGGMYGATAELPAGCYSDDTQLRLATCRSIRGDGNFDPEAFTKIELTIWPAYSLGGGRGTKDAAQNAGRSDVNWFSNFYRTAKTNYLESGGNGAAMRIQPHVWAAKDPCDASCYLLDVIKNTIATHGHVRAVVGASFHAMCLASCLVGDVPGPSEWRSFVKLLGAYVPALINDDEGLGSFWLPVWEQLNRRSFVDEFQNGLQELDDSVQICSELVGRESAESYREIVQALDGFSSAQKGSGLRTAVFASALAWIFKDGSPKNALLVAANLLGSDTDSIGTMAGALLGAMGKDFTENVMDMEYIAEEAGRLSDISAGRISKTFHYPDLLTWKPPTSQSDVVFKGDGKFIVAGLGVATPFGKEYESKKSGDAVWQWMQLEYGQSLIIKRRRDLEMIDVRQMPIGFEAPTVVKKRNLARGCLAR
jgi:ADP-ribosylglycohydrolase